MEKALTKEKAIWMYQKMQEIRQFEDRVHALFTKGILPGFVHLYAGEEAVAVGVCAHLNEKDSITSTHRGHGPFPMLQAANQSSIGRPVMTFLGFK